MRRGKPEPLPGRLGARTPMAHPHLPRCSKRPTYPDFAETNLFSPRDGPTEYLREPGPLLRFRKTICEKLEVVKTPKGQIGVTPAEPPGEIARSPKSVGFVRATQTPLI
jgi:hypothetical protein